jgi:hypothetical protein
MAVYDATDRLVRVRVVWDWNNGAGTIMNHFSLGQQGNTAVVGDALADVQSFVTTRFPPILDGAARLKVIELEDIITKAFVQAEPAGIQGAGGGGAMPATIACIVSLRSDQRRRYRNGRFRVGGLNRSFADVDILSSTGITAFNTFTAAMMAAFVGGAKTSAWSLIVYTPGNAAPSHGPPWAQGAIDVQAIRVAKILSTVRTRRVGVGI